MTQREEMEEAKELFSFCLSEHSNIPGKDYFKEKLKEMLCEITQKNWKK